MFQFYSYLQAKHAIHRFYTKCLVFELISEAEVFILYLWNIVFAIFGLVWVNICKYYKNNL